MTELDPKAWEDTYSGRERIRIKASRETIFIIGSVENRIYLS